MVAWLNNIKQKMQRKQLTSPTNSSRFKKKNGDKTTKLNKYHDFPLPNFATPKLGTSIFGHVH
jgi:hypothetical protein